MLLLLCEGRETPLTPENTHRDTHDTDDDDDDDDDDGDGNVDGEYDYDDDNDCDDADDDGDCGDNENDVQRTRVNANVKQGKQAGTHAGRQAGTHARTRSPRPSAHLRRRALDTTFFLSRVIMPSSIITGLS